MASSQRDACTRALVRELAERVSVDTEQLERCAWDYGRLVRRTPAAVVSVQDAAELQAALRIGAEFAMPIVTRGSGHSQSGQCLADGALVIDMKALNSVDLDADSGSGWLGAGATWHQVIDAAYAQRRMPVGPTMIVDTTVGGTLSVGGLGSESFRTGTQADQLLELEVATLDGQLVRCSFEHNRELFDAVRAGVGQCGVIVRARYPLREAKTKLRTYTFAYTDARALVADMLALGREPCCDFMFAAMLWNEQRGWQVLLFAGKEHDDASELNETTLLSALHPQRELARTDAVLWRADGQPGHPFMRRFVEQSAGVLHHPWVDHLCEPQAGAELLSSVLAEPAVAPRPGTSGVVISIAAHRRRAPLLQPQTKGTLLLLGLSPEARAEQLDAARTHMRRQHERGAAMGGKRYLSGFIDGWTEDDWSRQFGAAWPWFRSLKARYDPSGLLNNAFIRWR